MKCWCWCWIYDPKQKHQALHTSERTFVPWRVIFTDWGLRTEDWGLRCASHRHRQFSWQHKTHVFQWVCHCRPVFWLSLNHFGWITKKVFWLDQNKLEFGLGRQAQSILRPAGRSKLSPHDTCVSMSVSLQASSWSVFWLSLNRRGWLVGSQKRHFPSQIQRNIVKCYAGTNPSSAQQKQALPTQYEMCYCRPLGVCFGYHSTKKVFWLDQKRWSLDLGDRFNPSSAQRERALPTRQLHQSPTLISSSGDHSKTIWRFLGP